MSESKIAVANTHVLLDPPFARSEALKHFAPWLDVGREIVQFGADLLLRAFKTSERKVVDLVILGTLFRQLLIEADACLLCLENGAVQAAMLHARAEFEASLALEWTLTNGKDRWATQYYVSSLRQNRSWVRRSIPGTQEATMYAAAWSTMGASSPPSIRDPADAAQQVAEVDNLLALPAYKSVNDDFDNAGWVGKGAKKRFIEPNWYQPGTGGVRSIAEMARVLKHEAEYMTLYRYGSYFIHGSLADNHFKVKEGVVSIEPIRYLKQFALAFNPTLRHAADGIVLVTSHYRPGELGDIRARYADRWATPLLQFASVEVNTEWVSIS
ncbi:MAG TPA: DUF5677 domain-containing protein [Gemmatimonadaceae bacterium]|nr:DUF5677 domain-containing protein [Gemmatimonadaceae bacterium]